MKEKVWKCKSSPNLENTYKTEIITTMYDSIHSSTQTVSKYKINDQYVMNDQIDAHGLCSYRNYYKAFLNDEINDK